MKSARLKGGGFNLLYGNKYEDYSSWPDEWQRYLDQQLPSLEPKARLMLNIG